MPIDLATVALLGALQALLLAPLLLVATRAYAGVARRSLRLWGWVLLLQAVGWTLMGLRGRIPTALSVTLANGLLMASYAGTAHALRMLLGLPTRARLLILPGLAGWLGIAWFAQVRPDYAIRVYIATAALGVYLALLLWPLRKALRRGGSPAQRVMLLILLAASLGWLLRLRELGGPQAGLLTATPGNVYQLVYSALEPALASIGFLLLYNEAVQAKLRRLARTDPLTGVLNRLALDEELARLFRAGGALAVLLLDIDHFKDINDRHGHAGGDEVLVSLAGRVHACLCAGQPFGRVGGEEFLVLLPGADLAAAQALAERLRATVAEAIFLAATPAAVTLSLGVAVRHAGDADAAALLRRADDALYAAKHGGRNRVALALP